MESSYLLEQGKEKRRCGRRGCIHFMISTRDILKKRRRRRTSFLGQEGAGQQQRSQRGSPEVRGHYLVRGLNFFPRARSSSGTERVRVKEPSVPGSHRTTRASTTTEHTLGRTDTHTHTRHTDTHTQTQNVCHNPGGQFDWPGLTRRCS